MIATTGAELLPNSASRALREKLLPVATILTPNVPEANTLLLEAGHEQHPVQSVADLEEIALKVQKLGSKWVLVKGGHSPFRRDGTEAKTEDEKEIVVNVLVGPAAAEGEGTKRDAEGEEKLQVVKIEMPYQRSRNTHGTGCSLACKFELSFPLKSSWVSNEGTEWLTSPSQPPSPRTWPRGWTWSQPSRLVSDTSMPRSGRHLGSAQETDRLTIFTRSRLCRSLRE